MTIPRPLLLTTVCCIVAVAQGAVDVSVFETEIGDLKAGLGVDAMVTAYNGLSFSDMTRDGATIRDSMVTSLETKMSSRISALTAIRDATQTAFASPPTGRTVPAECCTLTAPPLLFSTLFHTDVDLEGQCYRYPSGKSAATTSDDRTDEQVLSELLSTYLTNQAAEPNLKWQYVGTQRGVYSFFPAAGRSGCDNYDPRFRPWYVLAATPDPKDVIVVIDTSGSMGASVSSGGTRMSVAKAAADVVLDTLNPNDRVTVMEFNTVAGTASGCFGSELAAASPQNVASLKTYVSGLSAGGGTYYARAFDKAFDLFAGSPTSSNQKVILFLTDGEPSDGTAIEGTVDSRNSDRSVKIFPYAFSDAFSGVPTLLQDVADDNGGVATYVPDNGDLRTAMGGYYEALSTPDPSRPAVWTTPYFDASGLGVITSAALPVYESTTLTGVAAVDLTLTDLLGDAAFFDGGELSYAFVVDDRGRALIHPNLALPDDITDDPSFVDISLLETQSDFTAVRTAMLNRETGSNRHLKARALPRGDSTTEGVRTQNIFVTYYYAPVANTPFSVAVVLADDDMTYKTPSAAPAPSTPLIFHRLDVSLEADCHHFGQNSIVSASTYKFAPSMYVNPALHLDSNLTQAAVGALQSVINSASSSATLPAEVELVDSGEARLDVWATAAADTTWLDSSNDAVTKYAAWRYIGTSRGTFRTFPGHPSSAAYDPRLRPWYRRALTNEGSASFSTVYEDAAGAGLVITMSHTITPSGVSSPIAVMGLDFSLHRFQTLLETAGCSSDGVGSVCFVMDDSGYIVFHPDFASVTSRPADISATFVGDYYPQLASALQSNGILFSHECLDFPSRVTRRFYIGERADTSVSVTGATATVTHVSGTNIYLVDVSGSASALESGSSTVAPATTALTYDECEDEFTFSTSTAICPAPDAGGSLSFEPPLLPGLSECYGADCSLFSTQDSCLANIQCISQCEGDGYCVSAGTAPITCPSPSPSPAPIRTVTGSATVAGASFDAYNAATGAAKSAFKAAFRSDIGSLLGISSSAVEVTSVSAGSIKVDFEVLTRDTDLEQTLNTQGTLPGALASSEAYITSSSWCSSSPCDLSSSVSTGDEESSSSNTAVIAAVVVVVVVLAGVVAACFCWKKKKDQKRSQFQARQTTTAGSAPAPAAAVPGPTHAPVGYGQPQAEAPVGYGQPQAEAPVGYGQPQAHHNQPPPASTQFDYYRAQQPPPAGGAPMYPPPGGQAVPPPSGVGYAQSVPPPGQPAQASAYGSAPASGKNDYV